MAIHRQKCISYANPALKFDEVVGLLYAEQVGYIVRTAIKNIGGRRILLLYIFSRDAVATGHSQPLYTVFQARDDYITLEQLQDGGIKWRVASFFNLGERYTYLSRQCAFYTHEDEQRVAQFCGTALTGLDPLIALQEKIMQKRLKAKIKAREMKIIQRMKELPPLPRDYKGWIHREVLPAYIFYEYHRSKKPMKGYCSACRHDVLVSGARHNQQGVCPHCRRTITFKATGRSGVIRDRATAQVLQRLPSNELVLRICKVSRVYSDYYNPCTGNWENARAFIQWDAAKNVSVVPYYYSYTGGLLTQWKKGERPVFFQYSENFEADVCGHLYDQNLDEVLAGMPWQYSQIKDFYLKDQAPLEVIPYLNAYMKYPIIESLVKLDLCRIAAHVIYSSHIQSKIINANSTSIREALGLDMKDLQRLRSINADIDQLELYQSIKKQKLRFNEALLRWYQMHRIRNSNDILVPLRFMSAPKLMRYVDKQFVRLKGWSNEYDRRRFEELARVLSEYKDYLFFNEKLKYDLRSNFVLFPRNLPEAHDQVNALFDDHKVEIYNSFIEDAYHSLLKQYRFQKNGLTLIPPKSAAEIVSEGHKLHHCVSGYVSRVAESKCIILFLRKTDYIDEPFYTVELREDKVVQVRGLGNQAPTPEVERYISLWERAKLQAGTQKAA